MKDKCFLVIVNDCIKEIKIDKETNQIEQKEIELNDCL